MPSLHLEKIKYSVSDNFYKTWNPILPLINSTPSLDDWDGFIYFRQAEGWWRGGQSSDKSYTNYFSQICFSFSFFKGILYVSSKFAFLVIYLVILLWVCVRVYVCVL